jgi:hypothetical protein
MLSAPMSEDAAGERSTAQTQREGKKVGARKIESTQFIHCKLFVHRYV